MRHRRNTTKLKRSASHRRSLLANLACSLIEHGRIKTTSARPKPCARWPKKWSRLASAAIYMPAAWPLHSCANGKPSRSCSTKSLRHPKNAMADTVALPSSAPVPVTRHRWPSSNGWTAPQPALKNLPKKPRKPPNKSLVFPNPITRARWHHLRARFCTFSSSIPANGSRFSGCQTALKGIVRDKRSIGYVTRSAFPPVLTS